MMHLTIDLDEKPSGLFDLLIQEQGAQTRYRVTNVTASKAPSIILDYIKRRKVEQHER